MTDRHTDHRAAVAMWGVLFLAGLLAYLTRGPAWLLASLDDEQENRND